MWNSSYEYLISNSVAGTHMYFTFKNQGVVNGKVHKNNIIFHRPSHIIYLTLRILMSYIYIWSVYS